VPAGAIEAWRIFNFSADTHPVHFHLVNVQVLQREAFVGDGITTPIALSGMPRGPELNEIGWKETVQMHPGEATTVIMKFDLPATRSRCPRAARRQHGLTTPGKTYHEYVCTATSLNTKSTT